MSGIKNWNMITQCDHIKLSNRGHHGGVSFDFISLNPWGTLVSEGMQSYH